ncbi:MAG: shikimate kinase [Nakamurella sp.]
MTVVAQTDRPASTSAPDGPVVVLVGAMGAGKTSVAQALAAKLQLPVRDTDHDVEAVAGRTISDIFVTEGEPAFRALERSAVAAALAEHRGILALGGGAVLAAETRALLAGHPVVHLRVSMPQGVRRTGLNVARPLLAGVNPRATYKALLEARLPIYRSVAAVEVDTDDRTVVEVADAVIAWLAGR